MKTAFFILLPITILAVAFVLRMIWLNVKLSEKPKPHYPSEVNEKLSMYYEIIL